MSLAAYPSPTELATHRRIITAARRLFSRQGYEGTSTRAIAAEAAVAEGTLFRHFDTKHAVLEAVLHDSWQTLLGELLNLLGEVSDFRDLRPLLSRCLQLRREEPELLQVCLSEVSHEAGLRERMQERFLNPLLDVLEAFLQTGMERGFYRVGDPRPLAALVLGLLLFLLGDPLLLPGLEADQADQTLSWLDAVLNQGLRLDG